MFWLHKSRNFWKKLTFFPKYDLSFILIFVFVCFMYKQRWSVGPPDQDFRKNTVYNLYCFTTKPHLLAGQLTAA